MAHPTRQIFRPLMTGRELSYPARSQSKKSAFFFCDNIVLDDNLLSVGDEQWLYEVDGERFFLSSTSRSPSLTYFQHLSMLCHADWESVRPSRGVIVSQFEDVDIPPHAEEVLGLFLGYLQNGYPQGEGLCLTKMFGR